MSSDHDHTYGHNTIMPCLCPDCLHATSNLFATSNCNWYDDYNVYQQSLHNPFSSSDPFVHYQQEANNQINNVTNEIDSWFMLNPADYAHQDQTNHASLNNQFYPLQPQNQNYGMVSTPPPPQQQQQQIMLNFSQGIQTDFSAYNNAPAIFLNASLPSIGSFSNTAGEWGLINQLSFLPFHAGNLRDEMVGISQSNLSCIPSEGTQQPASTSQIPPPMSRKERVQRYFEKKKARKYEKKIQFSSRRMYAQTRPRVRGRFISTQSQTDGQ